MKKLLYISFLIMLVLSCKNSKEIDVLEENSITDTIPQKMQENVIVNTKRAMDYEYLFVSAKSGLNYRDKPEGEIIGKFPLNTYLKVLEKTRIFNQIKDGDAMLEGEWTGVEKDMDTVYVFSAFLSHSFTYSDIKVYYTSPYSYGKKGEAARTAFVNVTETLFHRFPHDYIEKEGPILSEKELLKDTIRLNPKKRKQFLQKINVSESDKIFIYELIKDSVYTYQVKDLPLIACVDIYFNGRDSEKREQDFEFGFDLGKSYNGSWENFAYVGKENPFQTGKRKAINWEEVENERFPISKKEDNSFSLNTYMYSFEHFDYFLQKAKEKTRSYTRSHHLVVVDNTSNAIVFDRSYYSSEGIYLVPINPEDGYRSQYTGAIFKNKPPIIYGFTSHSFDCPTIEFINETEPPVPVLCDNRH